MVEDKQTGNESGGVVVFKGSYTIYAFFNMVRSEALSEGKVVICYDRLASGTENMMVVDMSKNELVFRRYVGELFRKQCPRIAHQVYIFDLSKINLDVLIRILIEEANLFDNVDFKQCLRRILENDFLRKKFCEMLESSEKLRQIIQERIKEFIEVAKNYEIDILLLTKLLI